MKRREILTYTLGAVGLAAVMLAGGACQAGFLHRTYQGSMEAHDHKYNVNVDGTIDIQTKESSGYVWGSSGSCNPCCNSSPCSVVPAPLYWVTKFTFANADELRNVIGDLQQVQKEIDAANAETPGTVSVTSNK